MPDDPEADADADDEPAGAGASDAEGDSETATSPSDQATTVEGSDRERETPDGNSDIRRERSDAHLGDDALGDQPGNPTGGDGAESSGNVERAAGSISGLGTADAQPHVSVTIEGEYDTVFERLEHPETLQHNELDTIVDNVEETLLAVVRTGGGIRSDIYEAADFELDDPWEIRIYLEVLAIHDLVHLQDDRWVPSDYFRRTSADDGP